MVQLSAISDDQMTKWLVKFGFSVLKSDQCLRMCTQVRHGAAVALRDVLQRQADAAAVSAPVVAEPSGMLLRSNTLI